MVSYTEESNRGPRFFNLVVRFSDMCAFVPSRDCQNMTVLFPRCTRPKPAGDGIPIQAHFPVLEFALKDLRKRKLCHHPDPPFKTLRHRVRDETMGLWFLDHQDLKIKTASRTRDLVIENSFHHYVAPMSAIHGTALGLNPHCLLDDMDHPPQEYVTARMVFDHGNLGVKEVARDPFGNEIEFRFMTPEADDPASFGDETFRLATQLELVIPEVEYVVFKGTRFCDKTDVESLVLASSREDLIVGIKNEPVEELLRLPWEYNHEDTQRARDFEAYYQMVAGMEEGDILPLIPWVEPSAPITSRLINCPSVQFEDPQTDG